MVYFAATKNGGFCSVASVVLLIESYGVSSVSYTGTMVVTVESKQLSNSFSEYESIRRIYSPYALIPNNVKNPWSSFKSQKGYTAIKMQQ
jgi:hypothetical protein